MAAIPAVLSFDVVGTLIDFEAGMLTYLRQACRDELAAVDDDTFLAAYRASRKNPDVIRWALTHFARTLGDPFDDSVTVDEAGCEKPDPRFFAFTLGRLSRDGHGLHDVLHVAQSQYHDIGVARRLGYTVCWIERRAGKADSGGTIDSELTQPDYHFTTLAALADALDAGDVRMK